jgi:hypothetical protein
MFQPVTLIDFFADFETRSRADLKKVGTVKYATDPSTEATLLTYAFSRTGPVKYWRMGQPIPLEVIDVLVNPHKYKIIAHNLFFDYLIWTIVFSKLLPAPYAFKRPEILNLEDNMALTTYYRFGSGLDAAATLMRMPYSKDKEGKRVMLKQCKPGKDGNFPVLTPEEEAKFIQYGLTDTRLMRDIYYQLPPLPAAERWAWEWTFKRNLRGIRVDVALLNEMKKVVDEAKPLLAKEFEYWTCNQATVSSPTTCLPWFKQFWPWIENMQADTIRDMFADTRQVPHHARRALELKELAGSTSISKVEVGVNEEYMGRLFGLFSYAYTFTRRWAGRGIQIQNFPRVDQKPYDPIIEDLNVHDLATPFKRRVALGLKDPIGFVKNHLRRIWIPDEGKEFLCGDFSKIEPTVLYWLVGKGAIPDKWYEEMAAEIFNKKVSEIDKHGEERQLGKAANLGCLTAETEVLTNSGWLPIVAIQRTDLVYDGEEYVCHEGLVHRGEKAVMSLHKLNIESTPDHLFMTNLGWQTAVELEVTEDTKPHQSERFLEPGLLQGLSSTRGVNVMSQCAVYVGLKRLNESTNYGQEKHDLVNDALNLLLHVRTPSQIASAILSPTTLLEDVGAHVSTILKNDALTLVRKTTRGMVVEELLADSTPLERSWNTLLRCLGLTNGASLLTGLITTETMKPETYELLAKELTTRISHTYDLQGVGLKNSFSLRKGAAHNCGYGMGAPKFKADVFKKEGVVIAEEMAKRVVDTYRRVNKEVVELWTDLENAFRKACLGHSSALCGNKIHVMPMRHPWKGVVIRLPSGNHLYYHYAQIEPETVRYQSGEKKGEIIYDAEGREKTRDVLTYASSEDGILSRKKVYGGLLTEHVVSCTARDILVPAMWRLEDAGFDVLACIHDEAWAQAEPGREEEFKRLMCINPSWCQDMKIGIGEEIGVRYLK